jgi:pimeloyl-ACP methyl ester carboxylesterase
VNLRLHGRPPYGVAVVHGGPGAAGEVAPVARALAAGRGVLEPLQAATSVGGQVEELRQALESHGTLPLCLVGHSWGAWLIAIAGARHPHLARKLVLVGSGPFEERYAPIVGETRARRLGPERATEYETIRRLADDPAARIDEDRLSRLGALAAMADAYDPLPQEDEGPAAPADIFAGVWREAATLRRTGDLLRIVGWIRCPVVAIHGDHDPHPASGVLEPLSRVLRDFRFISLARCGHRPWAERQAAGVFYRVLEEEVDRPS